MAEAVLGTQRRGTAESWRRWTALAAACLLGACQTLVPRGPGNGPQRPAPVAAPAQTAPTDSSIPRDTARNRVALLVPVSGRDGAVGRSLANATQLALLDSGNEKVRITTYDTAAAGAGAAARRAVAEGAELILGPLLAEDVRAVAPVAHAAGVPVIGFSNDTGVAGGGVYLMAPLPTASIERVVGFARARGITTFAGLMPAGVYGERSSTAFLRAVEAAGGQVTALETYTGGASGAAVAKLAAKAPFGAVLIADGSRVAALIAPGLRKGSPGVHILGTDRWNSEPGVRSQAALNGAWFASVPNGLYQQFVAKYRARFGEDPFRLSSLGYDAVLLTIRIARDWPVGQRFPEARLRDPDGFAGLDGAFRFGRDGLADRGLEVQEVRGGSLVTVSPAPAGFGR
jgi:ABC-type branched-subunit amino acid transport system substrate-binding protein